ncbi:MAG: ester cyclase [Actinomycetota bacterium]|nr:ester cyclase [Actinomycetota bacterium]
MGVEGNKKTVQLIEDAYNRGDLNSLNQYFAEGFDNSQSAPPGFPIGIEPAKQMHLMSMQAYPDRKTEILQLIGEGNKVMAFVRVTGTNKGGVPWFEVPANNAKMDFNFMSIFEFDDQGMIIKHTGLVDGFTQLVQLGVYTPPSTG